MIVSFEVSFVGRVQGVGFRFLCVRKANSLGVRGWVRNSTKENMVEAIFQGEKKSVEELIKYFKENPYSIRVDSVSVNDLVSVSEFKDFSVKY